VRVTDLQSVLPPSVRSVVLKVDVEGFECNTLGGALEYLNQLDILYVAFEWSPLRLRQCQQLDEILELFRKNRLMPYLHCPAGNLLRNNVWKKVDPARWESWTCMGYWLVNSFVLPATDPLLTDIAWVRE